MTDTTDFERARFMLLNAIGPAANRCMASPDHHTLLTPEEVAGMTLHGNALLAALDAERKCAAFKVVDGTPPPNDREAAQ